MEELTIERLEELNRSLAEEESKAHNLREKVLGLIHMKRQASEDELPDEDQEVLEVDIQKLEEEVQDEIKHY